MKKRLVLFIATAGGFGYSPVASGTAGSAVAIPFAYLLMLLPPSIQLIIIAICYCVFAWAAREANEIFGRHDAGEIVCDEVLGMWITLFAFRPDSPHLALGFLLFRFFDILKPFPAGRIDRNLKSGHGVMLDDVVAGIYANLCLRLFL